MFLSSFLDKFYYSEFYFHHSGFDSFLEVTLMDKRHPNPGGSWAVSEGAATQGPFRRIHAGRNVLFIEFPAKRDAPEEADTPGDQKLDPFVCLAFDHHHLPRRNRVDLFIAPGSDASHVLARLTASRKLSGEHPETLFEGEVALFADSASEPFVMHAPGA